MMTVFLEIKKIFTSEKIFSQKIPERPFQLILLKYTCKNYKYLYYLILLY